MVCVGYRSRKKFTDAAMALTWPGVPVTAWANMRPRKSNSPAERSPASRTVVEKAVRMIDCACSSTMAIMRSQSILLRTAPSAMSPGAAFSAASRSSTISPSPLIRAVNPSGTMVVVCASVIAAGPTK